MRIYRIIVIGAAVLMATALPVQAKDAATRAMERQADALERMERLERERARDADRVRRNAARDARSSRRFDRP